MSRSNKWKQEWAFFLDADGRRKYNDLCRRCANPCKQSFRAVVVSCHYFSSKRAEEICCKDKG